MRVDAASERETTYNTYVGVRRGDRAAQTGVCRRRNLVVIHVIPVAHVVASTGAGLNVASQFQFEFPRRLHERTAASPRLRTLRIRPREGRGPHLREATCLPGSRLLHATLKTESVVA